MLSLLPLLLLPAAEFNRDIRPILSDACFTCHGPDAGKRKADLRLDTEAGVRKAFAGGEAWKRINDHAKPMPPRKADRQLTAAEKATLKGWIAAGARWQKHWSFIPPKREPVPAVPGTWARNPIDRFLLARLQKEGLRPSPEADRATWLRRVTLDLTGVPPTITEQDAFFNDKRPDAHERVIDRLLASPRLGERLAIRWIDAARYADTSGYQNDGPRIMWRWRDWVIDAYNQNLPFDRFTIEQLAGDLLPKPTLEQRIATGFNRNHRGNAEGGIIPAEYAAEYVADRVETTATVWLGLTMTCARCHDHKYDPLSQKDFYRLFAFFNNVPERGKAVKFGNSPPMLLSPTRRQEEKLKELTEEAVQSMEAIILVEPNVIRSLREWKGPVGDPLGGEGPSAERGAFGYLDRFSLAARITPEVVARGTIVSRMADVEEGEGYAVRLHDGRVQVNLVKRWLDDAIRVETVERLKPNEPRHVLVVYDGTRVASGVRVYLDGKLAAMRVLLDDLNQTFASKEPFRVGAGGGPAERFRGRISDVRIYRTDLSDGEAEIAAGTPRGREAARRLAFIRAEPGAIRKIYERNDAIEKRLRALRDTIPTTMVMQEMPTPRPTHVLIRGQYDRPGEKVTPGTPAELSPWPEGAPPNRLGLARWLVDANNPLTARVAVNRLWQMLFGTGLVNTAEDFGSQGEAPTHPELLDWLAVEYRESGWDTKHLLRLIVSSAAYRQSSRVTPDLLRRDPDNRLLARGPRFRLSAEMLRDQALFTSGLLVEELGGPSVKPYQPAGLWRELADMEYVRDRGPALYRRGLYVYWKRTVAPPGMTTFDAAGRETCNVRDSRTNTPLQALNLLNDVTYVEAARVLAERALRSATDDGGRLEWMFRRVLCRKPNEVERRVLLASLKRHRAHYSADRAAAAKVVKAGDSPRDEKLDVADRAAFAALAGTLLNLDEAITKE